MKTLEEKYKDYRELCITKTLYGWDMLQNRELTFLYPE